MDPLVEKYIPKKLRKEFIIKNYWINKTMSDFFDGTVKRYSDKEAIIFGSQRITFNEFADHADALVSGLLKIGIRPKDLVSVQLPNWPEFCYLQVALGKIGAILGPLHMVFRERELLSMLKFCESKALVIPSEYRGFNYAETIRTLWPQLPDLKYVIVVGENIPQGMISFKELLSHDPNDGRKQIEELSVDANDLCYLNFTSGTEGIPKGFLHTFNTILGGYYYYTRTEGESEEELAKKVILAHSPMTHTFGFVVAYDPILNGSKIVLVERYDPGEALELLEKEKITHMFGTPAHIIGLLNHEKFGRYNLSSMREISIGGAPCPVELIKEIREKIGCYVTNIYGMGETIAHTKTRKNDPPELIFESVGKPIPGTEVGIFDDTRSNLLGIGEIGEIAYRGPFLFICYFKDPQRTEETRNSEGWFFTGDMGVLDEKGYLRLAGRKKDLINRGGTKIFPDDIENILHLHPKILKAAVIGMPDYRLGEKVCAYIIPKKGETITLEEVVQFMESQKVMKYKIPERIEVVDEFPMLPSGKIKKESLRQDILEKLKKEQQSSKG